MAEKINSGDEERMPDDLNVPTLFEDMTGALKSDEILEATMSNVDQNSNILSDLLNKIRSVGQLESEREIEAASAKLGEWLTKNTEEQVIKELGSIKIDKEVLTMFGTVETVEEVANVFKILNWAMNDPDKFLEVSANNLKSVTEFFEKPLVKIYIKTQPNESYTKILEAAITHFGRKKLKEQLLAMLDSGAAKETTQFVLMELWHSRNYTAEYVFKYLELNEPGRNIWNSLRWSAWISYTIQSSEGKETYAVWLLMTRLKNNFDDEIRSAWITSIEETFPEFVTASMKNKEAALPPNKRRRIDDGT